MNPLAKELNLQLEGTTAWRLLSNLGRNFYFPRGIVAQTAEAKKHAHMVDATIGMAFSGGKPLMLSAVAENMPKLKAEEAVAYAPTAGIEELRKLWQNLILQKNPSIKLENISLPVVTIGLTAGLATMAELFLDEGSTIISCDPSWDSYSLIFETRRAGILRRLPFTGASGLDLDAIGQAVKEEAKKGQVRAILNFPNNPAGYAPTLAEAKALANIFLEAAEGGADVLVLCDDAYFGFFYEDDVFKESLFSLFSNLHERILAVKIDGPIKEDYVWGFRTGFVTFGSCGLKQEQFNALVTKLLGAIRSSVSSASTPAQHIVIKAIKDERTSKEKAAFKELLRIRYSEVKKFLNQNPEHPVLKPFPFNSGYFMSFRCEGVSAEALRKELLLQHGIGVVALGEECLRIAYSIMEEDQIYPVFKAIYDCAKLKA